MKDYLIRAITRNENIRALSCVTTVLVGEACHRNGTLPTASAALGRALTGGALMGALLKTGQRVALKFQGNGPLKKILVEAESDGTVRGYVGEPQVDLPLKAGKLDVSGAIGQAGFLTVSKDLRLKEPYRGIVRLYSGEIAEDIAYYLTESEQIPSAVGLGVHVGAMGIVSAAGGFLIQTFPPSNEEVIDRLVNRIGTMPPVTEMVREGKTPEDILNMLFFDVPFDILEKRPLALQCSCSRARVEQALLFLGREEISKAIAENEKLDASCEFCGETYIFSRDDLEGLLGGMRH